MSLPVSFGLSCKRVVVDFGQRSFWGRGAGGRAECIGQRASWKRRRGGGKMQTFSGREGRGREAGERHREQGRDGSERPSLNGGWGTVVAACRLGGGGGVG